MKAVTGIFSNIFGKVGPIVKGLGRLLQALMLLSVFGMNLLMGYIMFAPDDLPKPFRLNYAGANTIIVAPPGAANLTEPTQKAGSSATPVEATEVPAEPGNGKIVDTGSKIVNLADPGGRRYLRATVALEVMPPAPVLAAMHAPPKGAEAAANPLLTAYTDEINLKMPIINDTITSALSSKAFDSIYTNEGKNKLRDEIKELLNERLPDLQVIAVYFTEFVVQ